MQSAEIFDKVLRTTDVTLFPHQVAAIQWMQRTERRTRMVSEQPHGGILAHAMGLGKTITTLSLMLLEGIGCTIVVCPKSVINQWRDEAIRILKLAPEQVVLYHGSLREAELLKACQRGGPRVVLTTFDIVRLDTRVRSATNDYAPTRRVVKAVAGHDDVDAAVPPSTNLRAPPLQMRSLRQVQMSATASASVESGGVTLPSSSRISLLHSEHWDRIILDEAHRICEQSSKTARAIRTLRARNRWCITGTPFKNGISDLVALSKFLLVPPYCNSTWWRCHSHNKHKISEWRNMFMNIQDKSVLALASISYNVMVIPPTVAEEQITLHVNNMFNQHIQNDLLISEKTSEASLSQNLIVNGLESMDEEVRDGVNGSKRKIGLTELPRCNKQEYELLKIMRLRQAANHSLLLTNTSDAMLYLLTAPSLGTTPATHKSPSPCHGCGCRFERVPTKRVREVPVRTGLPVSVKCSAGVSASKQRSEDGRRAKESASVEKSQCTHVLCSSCSTDMIMCPVCLASSMELVERGVQVWRHSSKTRALSNYLKTVFESDATAKVVLFSQWTTCLDLLGAMLNFMGIEFGRFDGRVNSIDDRADIISKFKTVPTCQVLLTSLGAGGEGLNLTFANHVVLMEPYWNIAVEQQAIDRLHRIGQTRTTSVLRLYTKHSIEHWVQDIQIKKNKELKRLLSEDAAVVGSGECQHTSRITERLTVPGLVLELQPTVNGVDESGSGGPTIKCRVVSSEPMHDDGDNIRVGKVEGTAKLLVPHAFGSSAPSLTQIVTRSWKEKQRKREFVDRSSDACTEQGIRAPDSDVLFGNNRLKNKKAELRKSLGFANVPQTELAVRHIQGVGVTSEVAQVDLSTPDHSLFADEKLPPDFGEQQLKVPLRGFSNRAQRQAAGGCLPYCKNRFKIASTRAHHSVRERTISASLLSEACKSTTSCVDPERRGNDGSSDLGNGYGTNLGSTNSVDVKSAQDFVSVPIVHTGLITSVDENSHSSVSAKRDVQKTANTENDFSAAMCKRTIEGEHFGARVGMVLGQRLLHGLSKFLLVA